MEPMETKDHREKPTEDSLTDFMCWNRDIFADDPFPYSQLERMVKASNLVDLAVPPRDSESALDQEPSNLDRYQNFLDVQPS